VVVRMVKQVVVQVRQFPQSSVKGI